MDTRPVGVFDSGFGGISVLIEAKKCLPHENYIYFGDNKNAPYGDKSESEIKRLSFVCADYLVSRGVKAMLIACNTATGTAIKNIRSELKIPVVSIEPAIKPACEKDGDGKIIMMATKVTTQMTRYKALLMRMPDPSRVINVPCPGLADRIERGFFGERDFDALFDSYFSAYEGQKIDSIVLGCTHYVFIKEAIKSYAARHFDGECTLIDGNAGTARQLRRVLCDNGLENVEGTGQVEFHTSGDVDVVMPIFQMLMQTVEK